MERNTRLTLPTLSSSSVSFSTKLEAQVGHSVISSDKASDYLPPADRWQSLPEEDEDEQ